MNVSVAPIRRAVGQLIERKTRLHLSLSATSTDLAAWGFTAQKPIRPTTERDEAAIRAWLDHDYPAIIALEPNLDEYPNNDVKQASGRRRPAKVRSFFETPDVRYAA